MPAFRTERLAIAALIVVTATSCGPTLYYTLSQTRTYEYERRIPIVVRSDPAGATIMTSDGAVLGKAPMVVDAKVRVRRTHRFRNINMSALGCVIDVGASAYVIDYWWERGFSDSQFNKYMQLTGLFFAGGGVPYSCVYILLDRIFFKYPQDRTYKDERIIPSSLDLTGRWDGLGEVRAQLELPATRTFTLRLPRTYTFEEALILWARETASPSTAENLYRVGDAYRILALRGVPGAMERAMELFTQHLQLYPAAEHADDVRRALEELRPQERLER